MFWVWNDAKNWLQNNSRVETKQKEVLCYLQNKVHMMWSYDT
jgi:hypothetical protein